MNGPIAAVVIFFLLMCVMCVKCLLLSLTPFLRYQTQTPRHTLRHTHTITKMLHFLLDNVYIQVGDHVFQQCTGIPMGTNCSPLLADLLLHEYESAATILVSRGVRIPSLNSSVWQDDTLMTSLQLTTPGLIVPSGIFTRPHSPLRKRICRIIGLHTYCILRPPITNRKG